MLGRGCADGSSSSSSASSCERGAAGAHARRAAQPQPRVGAQRLAAPPRNAALRNINARRGHAAPRRSARRAAGPARSQMTAGAAFGSAARRARRAAAPRFRQDASRHTPLRPRWRSRRAWPRAQPRWLLGQRWVRLRCCIARPRCRRRRRAACAREPAPKTRLRRSAAAAATRRAAVAHELASLRLPRLPSRRRRRRRPQAQAACDASTSLASRAKPPGRRGRSCVVPFALLLCPLRRAPGALRGRYTQPGCTRARLHRG